MTDTFTYNGEQKTLAELAELAIGKLAFTGTMYGRARDKYCLVMPPELREGVVTPFSFPLTKLQFEALAVKDLTQKKGLER
jgi:hypothetical protein